VISNRGIEAPGISLIKAFDQAQREYHQAWIAGDTNQETAPFVWSLVLADLATFGTAAPYLTQVTMLIVVAILLPIMLIYNGYQYLVFRGKVTGTGYGASEE
jgi:cytochrome bd-type quinol oxidase subunit 2